MANASDVHVWMQDGCIDGWVGEVSSILKWKMRFVCVCFGTAKLVLLRGMEDEGRIVMDLQHIE